MDMLKYEQKYWNKGYIHVAGIDEAGRGPLAGPVVASCVIFKKDTFIPEIKDSKRLSEKKRNILYDVILNEAISVGIGVVHEDVIDDINILQATYLAMKKSIGELNVKPQQILIDGPSSNIKQFQVEHIINGDNLSQSIAAASIIAKVYRDKLMYEYDKLFPCYNFRNNKGYGTKEHICQIEQVKSSPIHRKSFKIVKKNLPTYNDIEKAYGFHVLGVQCVAEKFIKRGYVIIDQNISDKSSNNLIELYLRKDSIHKFIKVKYYYKESTNIVNDKKNYLSVIKKYIKEKDMKSDFDFVVISVEFILKNKPILKTIEII